MVCGQANEMEAIKLKARLLAITAVRHASDGNYEVAVEHFTKAISLDESDYRFFLNRSFCFYYMGQYDKSLADADKAIDLTRSMLTPKPVYRRALALVALNRPIEALESFEKVLRIDDSCPVSEEKRIDIRCKLLLEAGFPEQDAHALSVGRVPLSDLIANGNGHKSGAAPVRAADETAERLHNRLVDETVGHMISQVMDQSPAPESDGPVDAANVMNQSSGDAAEPLSPPAHVKVTASESMELQSPQRMSTTSSVSSESDLDDSVPDVLKQVHAALPDLLDMGPVTNPIGFHALTASNVSKDATRPELTELFSPFGTVAGVFRLKRDENSDLQPDEVSILVNFQDPVSPARAVDALRCAIFWDGLTANPMRPLSFRLTASIAQREEQFLSSVQAAADLCLDADECFMWRSSMGCPDDDCMQRHMRANHRIDSHNYFFTLAQPDASQSAAANVSRGETEKSA
jgi:hypothetical protein